MFPRLLTERKARFLWNTRACFSPLWLLRVTGNCFSIARLSQRDSDWCTLQVSICSSFLFSWCGGLLRFWRSISSLTAYADSLRYDRYAWTVGFWNFLNRQILEIPTDRHMKVCAKTVWFWKSLHVQSKVLVNWDLWEAGMGGFLRGATWFRWSRARRFDQWRTIAKFGDPSGEHTVKHYCFIDIDLHNYCLG